MKKNVFVVSILILTLLASFFWAGGARPALAAEAFLDDIAGISAYAQVTPGETFLAAAQLACQDTPELTTETYFICSVAIEGYADVYAPHVFVHADGWIMAYYLENEAAAKMIDVIAQPLVNPLVPTSYPTLIEQAVVTVAVATGVDPILNPIDVAYYDFSNSLATDMLLVAEDKAEDLGELGDDDHWFTLAMPLGEYYEVAYAFYQNYYPLFALDGLDFVETNADYIGPATLGSIYGTLDTTDLITGESYLFEVDTFSLAPAGYGALLVTYSGALGDFVIDSSDWTEEFTLTAPSTGLTDLFTFNFAPAAFGKVGPLDKALDQPASLTLSWGASTGAAGYEYCIDEIPGAECDTAWVSTGTATSITLSGLDYNAEYYWQVRAVNSYEETYADTGVWWSFKSITGTPNAFGKISPLNGATSVATSPLLDWTDAAGAEYYEYCVETIFNDCTDDTNTDWVNTGLVSQVVVSLTDSITYSWQVRAVNSAGTTYADSETYWSFTTVASFEKVSPEDNTIDVNPKAILEWDPMTGATGYQYCVDTTDNNSCSRWVSVETSLTATLKGLKYSTTYYWQVRAVTATGTTEADKGDWWTFTTRARNAPPKQTPTFEKISPVDGATNQSASDLKLDWQDVPKATSYAYCIDTTDDDKCTTWVKIYESEVTIPTLAYFTPYYWQVRATVAGVVGYADDGEYWLFTTIPEPVVIP